MIERSAGNRRRIYLALSLCANVGVLAFFKYYNFLDANFAALADFLGLHYPLPLLNIILPIGLSFHTFQAMSYTIEVYRGNQLAEKKPVIFALYVMFYPQLVAGPIERPQNLLHQFYDEHFFDYARAADALKLMAWGMFKKVVIADRLAVIVNLVYADPHAYNSLALLTATVAFAFQIYCDFSGYSDIAIGAAQAMGFRLMDNFNRPYHAASIAEFWKRWHISLSTWFRDYLYIPLGGNRTGKTRRNLNLFLTFLVSGLWHGASWTYVAWGAINGFYIVFAGWSDHLRSSFVKLAGLDRFPRLLTLCQIAITFGLTCLAWIFFRAKDLADAVYILRNIIPSPADLAGGPGLPVTTEEWLIAAGAILFMEGIHLLQRHRGIRHMLDSRPPLIRWGAYAAFIFGILVFGVFKENSFIYFQF